MALEGWGAIKAVCQTRKTELRQHLNGAVAKLNEARQAWLKEDRQVELKEQALAKQASLLLNPQLEAQVSLGDLRWQAQEAAQVLLRKGLDLPNPALEGRNRLKRQARRNSKLRLRRLL